MLNNSVTVLTQNWEPCQADNAARPLLYQHYESLVLTAPKESQQKQLKLGLDTID